jgi:hypothetical protein
MGVLTIAFSEDHILLFSAGFDHDIFVWNPYIGDQIEKSRIWVEEDTYNDKPSV